MTQSLDAGKESDLIAGSSSALRLDFGNFAHHEPLTMPELEPRTCSPTDIIHSIYESPVVDFQSQYQFNNEEYIHDHNFHHSSSFSASTQSISNTPSASSSALSSFAPPTPESCKVTDDRPDGKRMIDASPKFIPCSMCKRRFSSECSYQQHIRLHRCRQISFACTETGYERTFTSQKDLHRHRASSCRFRMQLERFLCTCDKSFARKDVRKRHMEKQNAGKAFPEHRCKACNHGHCECVLDRNG